MGSDRSHSGYGFLLVLNVGASLSNLAAIDRVDAAWSHPLLCLWAAAQQSQQSRVEPSPEIYSQGQAFPSKYAPDIPIHNLEQEFHAQLNLPRRPATKC